MTSPVEQYADHQSPHSDDNHLESAIDGSTGRSGSPCGACGRALPKSRDDDLCETCRYAVDVMGVEVRPEDGGSGDQPTMADELLAGGGDARPDDRETVEEAESALDDIRPDDAPDPDDEANQMGFGSGDWGTVEKPPYEIPDVEEIRVREGESGFDLISTFSGCGGTSAGFRWAGFDVLWASEFVEAARETYEANWPSTPVDPRDIREVSCDEILDTVGRDVGEIDVLEGGPPCFPAGTPVVTDDGEKAIEDVGVGDRVLTHRGRRREVADSHRRWYEGDVVEIAPKYRSEPIVCTPEHPLRVRRRVSDRGDRFGEPEWVAAGDVEPGDAILSSTSVENPDPNVPDVTVREGRRPRSPGDPTAVLVDRPCEIDVGRTEVAWALGLYVADGWRRGREPTIDEGGKTRREVIFSSHPDDVTTVVRALERADARPKPHDPPENTAWKVWVHSVDWWAVCGEFGDGSDGKRIPEWVFGMPTRWRRAFVDGYVFGDGNSYENHGGRRIRAATVSPELARGMARLVQQTWPVAASVSKQPRRPDRSTICGREVDAKPVWKVAWTQPTDHGNNDTRAARVDDRGVWAPVDDVRRRWFEGYVFNLEVDEDQSYTARTFAAHNCAAFSVSGKREYDSDEVKKYSDTEQRVDDLFHEFQRLVEGLEPKVFLIENVPSLVTGGAEAVFREIMGLLRDAGSTGYVVDARVLNAKNHGAPQSRARLFIQGVRRDLREAHDVMPAYPRDLRYQYSIRDAIPWVGENAEIQWDEKSFNDEDEPHPADRPCPTLMAGGLGGVAHHQGKLANADWAAMVPDEEQEVANDLRKYAIGDAWLDIDPGEQSEKYFNLVRPDPDEPCPTITQTGGSYGAASVTHPHEPRKFTIPELRRLAGFPDDFELTGAYRQRWERLGRAVPPPLSKRIAEAIRDDILNRIEEESDD